MEAFAVRCTRPLSVPASVLAGVGVLLMCSLPAAPSAGATGIYRLDLRCEGPFITLPVHVVVNIYDGHSADPRDLVGCSTADYDGVSVAHLSWDDVACITGVEIVEDRGIVRFMINGYDHGEFDNKTLVEVLFDNRPISVKLDTDCSRMIRSNHPYASDPFGEGTFFIEGSDGICPYPHEYCPIGDRIYWLRGEFRIPCPQAGELTLRIYHNEDDLQATATAEYDGVELVHSFCSYSACLTAAHANGDRLAVAFDAYGPKDDLGFYADTRVELEVSGCGTYYTDLHTSCSSILVLHAPYETLPAGTLTIREACGGCIEEGTTPVEERSWGEIKTLFR